MQFYGMVFILMATAIVPEFFPAVPVTWNRATNLAWATVSAACNGSCSSTKHAATTDPPGCNLTYTILSGPPDITDGNCGPLTDPATDCERSDCDFSAVNFKVKNSGSNDLHWADYVDGVLQNSGTMSAGEIKEWFTNGASVSCQPGGAYDEFRLSAPQGEGNCVKTWKYSCSKCDFVGG